MAKKIESPTARTQRMSKRTDERMHDRFELQIDLKLQIIIPEQSFEPHAMTAQSLDVSAMGMHVIIDDMPNSLYTSLLMRTRSVGLEFTHPQGTDQMNLTGRVAWIDYHKAKASDQSGPCQIGISFDDETSPDYQLYAEFVQRIEAA